MTDRPILFSGEMVRAILSGSKTQTRRVMRPSNSEFGAWGRAFWEVADFSQAFSDGVGSGSEYLHVPVKPGTLEMDGIVDRLYPRFAPARCWDQKADRDFTPPASRLWVREAWQHLDSCAGETTVYRATDAGPNGESAAGLGWRPSIHMPRWASRITLEITNVRVERVQDISDADCIAEGCSGGHDSIPGYGFSATPAEHYQSLWDRINSPRGYGWDVNPWVWVIEFVPLPHSPHSDTLRKP